MMRYLYGAMGILLLSGCTQDQRLVEGATPLKHYNRRAAVGMKKAARLRGAAQLTSKQAETVATGICHAPVRKTRLHHRGQLLFYRVDTDKGRIEINALDGKVIKKECKQ